MDDQQLKLEALVKAANNHEEPDEVVERAEAYYKFLSKSIVTEGLEQAVFEALGAASVCWENLSGAGEFDSTRCKEIGEELMARIAQEVGN